MLDNRLLERVAISHSELLRGRLTAVDFVQGEVLAERNTPIERMIFPRSGLISILVELEDGDAIETGMVGCRGALGGSALFGASQHLHRAVVQVSGQGWSMRIDHARELSDTAAEFRELVFAQEQYLLVQSRQFAACNAKHLIVQRLCSWLLRAQDEVGGRELLITQENLAKMLGVQRASVSVIASQLQQKGLIGYRRGRVQISNPQALRASACECGDALKEQHEQLFANQSDGSGQSSTPHIHLGDRARDLPLDRSTES